MLVVDSKRDSLGIINSRTLRETKYGCESVVVGYHLAYGQPIVKAVKYIERSKKSNSASLFISAMGS